MESADYNPDAPIYTLVEFGDDIPNNYTAETCRDEEGVIIAQIIYDNHDRIVLFALYPDSGGTVVISTSYDNQGNITSNTLMFLDENGNVTETVDMLAQENQSTDYTDFNDYSSDSSAITVAQMESLDGGTMLMSSTPEAPASAAEIFDYDHLGNRYHETSKNGTVYEYSHNPVNQYAKRHYSIMGYGFDEVYEYDDNGNLYIDSDGNTYIYDYRNRLIQVDSSESSTIAEYTFDALGRRIKKVADGVTTYFFYDPQGRVIAEYEGTTPELTRTYVWGNGQTEILAMYLASHGNPDDWNAFLEFVSTWLLSSGQTGYDDSFDYVNDNKIDLKDFAHWASVWDMPSSAETDWYYLTDALGSVRGLAGGRFHREEDREFYNYDVYGRLSIQNPEESQSGNPYLFAAYRYDVETALYHTPNRTYAPETGRWLQFDTKGYIDTMNLYEYVASNPIMYIDPYGTNLYAIGGTCERRINNFNVAKIYNYYIKDKGEAVGRGKQYWNGPATSNTPVWKYISNAWTSTTGTSAPILAKKVKKQICEDYCKNQKMQINLVGWSRGASISLEIANMLEEEGCDCKCGNVKPSVNWMGLFDAVEMTVGSSMEENVTGNVVQADHAKRTKNGGWKKGGGLLPQNIFPRVSGKTEEPGSTVLTTREFYGAVKNDKKHGNRNYEETTHSDVGTGYLALRWMMKRAEKAGLEFDWAQYNKEHKQP